jgi:hypothetical protein
MNIKSRTSGLVLGGLLIILGVLALVETQTDLSPWIWFAVLTVGGLGVYAAYAMDRREKWMLVISYAMLAVAGLVALLELGVLKDSIVATYVLLAIAIPFLVAFFVYRKNWGYLIPAYVLLAIGVMVPLIEMEVLEDSWIATYVMLAIALPFFVAFLNNRKNWAFLIPAYVLSVIGIMVPLIEMDVLTDAMIVTYVLLAIAIPFFVVYLVDTKKWWALVPGGILAVIGFGFLIAEASVEYILAAGMIVFGIVIIVRQFTKRDGPGEKEALPEDETRDA